MILTSHQVCTHTPDPEMQRTEIDSWIAGCGRCIISAIVCNCGWWRLVSDGAGGSMRTGCWCATHKPHAWPEVQQQLELCTSLACRSETIWMSHYVVVHSNISLVASRKGLADLLLLWSSAQSADVLRCEDVMPECRQSQRQVERQCGARQSPFLGGRQAAACDGGGRTGSCHAWAPCVMAPGWLQAV
jgi:hypothetical protein